MADDIEIIDALVAMGYKVYEDREALKQVPESVKGMENRIREALKRLGKKWSSIELIKGGSRDEEKAN